MTLVIVLRPAPESQEGWWKCYQGMEGRLARSAGKRIMKARDPAFTADAQLGKQGLDKIGVIRRTSEPTQIPFEECAMQRKRAGHLHRVPGPGKKLENASCM